MAEIGNHAGNEPWPSLDWASWIFDRASFVLVISLIFGLAATVAIVWMGIIKEHHWDLLREHAGAKIAAVELEAATSNERIATINNETARLSAEAESARAAIAGANERAAKAEERAAEAKLELEKFRAPRSISNAARSQMADTLKKYAGTKFEFASGNDPESLSLVDAIEGILTSAGWVVVPSRGTVVISRLGKAAVAMAAESGVSVQALQSASSEITAGRELARLLSQAAIASRFEWDDPKNRPMQTDPTVMIAVGIKP